jgi:hypothetical protein
MLCKAENRDPAHCLKEGRKVTRCAAEVYVVLLHLPDLPTLPPPLPTQSPADSSLSIGKIRESCLAEFDAHWQCLEKNNQVRKTGRDSLIAVLPSMPETRTSPQPMRLHNARGCLGPFPVAGSQPPLTC